MITENLINGRSICKPSENIVAREIENELLIIPLKAGIADADDSLFTLSETAKVIWGYMDGTRSIDQIISILSEDYEAPLDEIQKDVFGFINELIAHKMVDCLND